MRKKTVSILGRPRQYLSLAWNVRWSSETNSLRTYGPFVTSPVRFQSALSSVPSLSKTGCKICLGITREVLTKKLLDQSAYALESLICTVCGSTAVMLSTYVSNG